MEEGNIKLIDGEVFSEKDLSETTNSILISKEVAEKIICRLAINLFGICIVKSLKIRWVTVMIVRLLQMMKMQRVKVQNPNKVVTADYPVKIAGIFSVVKKESANSNPSQERKIQSNLASC